MIINRFMGLFSAIFIALATFSAAHAQTSIVNEYTQSEIIAETDAFVPGETTWFALRQELRDGWHVFWTNPGDAGLPLELDWTLPEGFAVGDILQPIPEYIPVGPLASYAHEGEPVFLVPVRVPDNATIGDVIGVTINASWQTCEEICVPESGQFSFEFPVKRTSKVNVAHADVFSDARSKLPENYAGNASFVAEGDRYQLVLSGFQGEKISEAFFFAEPEGLIEPSAEQAFSITDDTLRLSFKPGWLERFEEKSLKGILVFDSTASGPKGFALSAMLPAPIEPVTLSADPTVQPDGANIGILLLLALLGGVILNIMPCVFPIVFIKAASFMKSAQDQPGIVRRHGLLYTGGVITTFLVMGGILLVLRAGGEQFGWGFHLQSPIVVAFSALVLLLVGLNLAGLFTVGQSVAGVGEGLARKDGALGAFFTGVLAVIVAAPCIGPLLSAPMGAALLLPPSAGMAIFAALGLGLALPYLALSLAPGLGRFLPKPGVWMATFKQLLAFPVFGAAAYFLWVLAQQSTGVGLATVLASAVAIALAAWLFEKSKSEDRRGMVLRVLSAVVTVAAIVPITNLDANTKTQVEVVGEAYGAMRSEPYSREALDGYRVAGVPVFIDFTAAWCVTCQFNKLTVFSDEQLGADFAEAGVIFMVADWTVRDPEITAALESFGASGVPLYVAYPVGDDPTIVPQPLTKNAVRAAVGLARR
ncbi:protein-disulfide reductase DsbD family protein [Hyphococcus lacteus]|uniref:Protein-disulfide reductase DsbD domain-containing protein n=1 Tax=Hyphococcus lacteus TaxID=3143536 RepID=A0ABV3Z4J7_9PROT